MNKTQQITKPGYQPRVSRTFSKELKKRLVEDIELKKLSIRDVINLYKVTETSVRRWINEYSIHKDRRTRMVVESESTEYKTGRLFDRISDLERALGKKQMEVEFLNKVVEICSEELGYDVKKKSITKQLSTLGTTGTSTGIK